MYTVGLLCPSLDDSSYKHFMIFVIHIKVLLSPSGFINVLDCVQAKRIHVGQGSEGKHLQTITDEYLFQTVGQTGEGEWLWLLRASLSLALSYCRMRNQHFTQMRPNHGHLHWLESLQAKKKGPPKKRKPTGFLQVYFSFKVYQTSDVCIFKWLSQAATSGKSDSSFTLDID